MSDGEQSKQVVLRLINEVMNRGHIDVIDELLAEDFVNHGGEVGGGPPGITPKQMFKRVAQDHHDTMGDLRVEIVEAIAEGEDVVVRSILNARHSGTMFGMPPTGNQLRFEVLHMYRVHDGKVTDHWECRDEPEMFRQLEALPPPLVKRIKGAARQTA
jgi:predicted ester cyclase